MKTEARPRDDTLIHEASPVRRLTMGYAHQATDGDHMVDLIDSANGNIIARCVYKTYAKEILAAIDIALGN